MILDYLQESHYRRRSPDVDTHLIILQTFWNEEGYMSETTITNVERGGRSGKGSVPLSVTVLNFDPSLGCDPATFQPCSDRALSSLKVLGDEFKKIFPITASLPPDQPSALFGAFYEEQIFGGHVRIQFPYLCFPVLSWFLFLRSV